MKNRIISFLIAGLGCLCSAELTFGQIAPVSSRTMMTTPYPLRLSDFLDGQSVNCSLELLLRDLNVSYGEVCLSLHLEGRTVRMVSTRSSLLPRYRIEGGVPLTLTMDELRPYFLMENLTISGISQTDLLRRATRLPDGEYQMWFEVYEIQSGIKVSAAEMKTTFWVQELDPPVLNIPQNNAVIYTQAVDPIMFSWTPRHIGRFNSPHTVVYDFELAQIPNGYRGSLEMLFVGTSKYYEQTLFGTTLPYDNQYLPLEANFDYAFRVRVRSDEAVPALFKNKGYSEIGRFQYVDKCTNPMDLEATSGNPTTISAQWSNSHEHQSYQVFYRTKDNTTDNAWFSMQTNSMQATIDGLQPATTYEVKIKAQCIRTESDESLVIEVTTLQAFDSVIACGIPPVPISDTCEKTIDMLKAKDVIFSAGSKVTITSVVKEGDAFTGTGTATLPIFNFMKTKVVFKNIRVNECYQHIAGVISTP